MADFPVSFKDDERSFFFGFGDETPKFPVDMGETQVIYEGAEPYTGEYDVIPRTNEQMLETANKRMAEDVVIRAIPYHSVSNSAKGNTVIIAGDGTMEVDYGDK